MLIYLYGPDSYRRQKKLKQILAQYKKKHSALTIEHFYLSAEASKASLKADFDRMKNFLTNQSLFGDARLAVVYDWPTDFKEKEALDFLKSLTEQKDTSVILVTDKALGNDFAFLLKKPALAQEFKKLTSSQLAIFVQQEAAERGLRLSPTLLTDLLRSADSDTWTLINEIEKLALGGQIEYTEAMPNFFVLLNRISGSYDISDKIVALTWLLENEAPAMIFNMLANSAKNAISKIKMADYDAVIKAGKLEYEEALLDLVLSG